MQVVKAGLRAWVVCQVAAGGPGQKNSMVSGLWLRGVLAGGVGASVGGAGGRCGLSLVRFRVPPPDGTAWGAALLRALQESLHPTL